MTKRKEYTLPPGHRRRISADAVKYLHDAVIQKSTLRQIAAEYAVNHQRVHQQVQKFPAALRADGVLCAEFIAWYNAQGVDTMPAADVAAWVTANAPAAPVESPDYAVLVYTD